MAVSDTSSDPWAHLYHHSPLPGQPAMLSMLGHRGPPAVESVVVTTTSATSTAGSYMATTPGSSSGHRPPAIDGRAGKSAKKRTRASRKAPTTLLNTDTTNFRAMVQQFTGIPTSTSSPAFTTGSTGRHTGSIGLTVQHGGQQLPGEYYQQLAHQHQHQLQRGAIAADQMGEYPVGNTGHDPFLNLLFNHQQRNNLDVPSDQFMACFSSHNVPRAQVQGRNITNNSPHGYVYDQGHHDDQERRYMR